MKSKRTTPTAPRTQSRRPRRRLAIRPSTICRRVAKQLLAFYDLPKLQRSRAYTLAELRRHAERKAERKKQLRQLLAGKGVAKKITRANAMELCAFVFCDCYEKGAETPPPSPTSSRSSKRRPRLPQRYSGQHAAFVAWHPCLPSPEAGSPAANCHALPYRRFATPSASPPRFPIFVGKVLNCQPTPFIHLT